MENQLDSVPEKPTCFLRLQGLACDWSKHNKHSRNIFSVHGFLRLSVNVWRRYCYSLGEDRDLENIPPGELNILFCRFFMDVRKKDGEVYEPVTLTSFQRSIHRYLNDRNSTVNILKDQLFSKSREVLSARKRTLSLTTRKEIARKLPAN